MVTPTSARQTRLLSILIIFVGLVVGYVYYSNFTLVGDFGVVPLPNDSQDKLAQFKNVEFRFQVFDSPTLKSLRVFGDSPVRPNTIGKPNPFGSF